MCRVSPTESNVPRILAQRAVNHIRMQWPACLKAFAVVAHRSEERSLHIIAMPGHRQIIFDALCGLWVNGETPLLAAFAHDLQRIEATVHVEVSDFQAG